jgi:PKD repeat protein
MKRIFGLIAVLVTLALGTSVFAAAFSPGNIVVYRIGDGSQPVTNLGQSVFLDEYTTNAIVAGGPVGCGAGCTPISTVQSIAMPTNWIGNQAPLIANGAAQVEGLMTRSVDGRYLIVPGFGATIAQLTNLTGYAFPGISSNADVSGSYVTNAVTEADVPRVIGLVDGNGNVYTSTTLTNRDEEGDEIRAAASTDGTNLWFAGGDGKVVKYTTRGSQVSTQVCALTSMEPSRAIGIFGNVAGGGAQLFIDKNVAFAQATNVNAAYNLIGGDALPVVSIPTNFVVMTGVTNGSQLGFAMFNLNNANNSGNSPDTLYLADSAANFIGEKRNYGGAVEKYCYDGGAWNWYGGIGAEDAFSVAGYQSGQNVSLYITEGTNNFVYYYTDTSGYDGQTGQPNAPHAILTGGSGGLVNCRGIAVVPQGGDSGTIVAAAGYIEVGPPYGPYFRGPQGGTFTPANGVTYSVANFGTQTSGFRVSNGPSWLTITPSPGTLSANGGSTTVTVTANANANGLNGGQSYTQTLIWHTGSSAGPAWYTNLATIAVDAFYLTPTTNFISLEAVVPPAPGSGVFTPSSTVYALSNATANALSYVAFTSNNWTSLSSPGATQVAGNSLSGSVPGHSAANITVSINNNANALTTAASYDDYLRITNVSASSQLAVIPEVILSVGFGIFDDFSQYQLGNVAGQYGWNGGSANPAIDPVQILTIDPVGLTNCIGCAYGVNEYVVPGGCADSGAQQPYKYVASGPITNAFNIVGFVTNNVPTYAITGVLITFTNAPTASNYVFEQGTTYLAWNDAGIEQKSGGYVWTSELDSYETGGGAVGTQVYNFRQQYQVYFVTDFVESNSYVFVNPPGSSGGITDGVSLVNNETAAPVLAVHSMGQTCPSADCLGNSQQGWESVTLGQYTATCPSGMQPGYFVTRVAASTNYLSVYNWLNPAPACTAPTASFTPASASGAAPLTVNFTDTSVANSGTLTTWVWTFGDPGNNTSSSQSPSFTYTTPGVYTVSLSVTNSCGDGSASPATATITVVDPFAYWESPSAYNLTGTLTGGNASYTGDGMSNTNKFMAGFSPTSVAAYLHIISISKAVVSGATNITVTYLGANGDSTWTPGVASRTNILEFSTGSGNGSYNGTFSPVPASGATNILSGGNGSGLQTSMIDSNVPASNDRYYRVRVLLP